MKKIVFVTYPTGREGTSALMGLINAMGVGPVKNFKDARNPMGFFEDPDYFRMLHAQFPVLFGGVAHAPPGFEEIQAQVDEHMDAFQTYLERILKRREAVAIKSPKYLCLFQYKHLRDRYDVRIIATKRKAEAVVKSLDKMWNRAGSRKYVSEDAIRDFVEKWSDFQCRVLRHFGDIPKLETSFEDLISDPHALSMRLADFIGVEGPPRRAVDRCIDQKLVSRGDYRYNALQWVSFKVHNFRQKVFH